MCCLDTLFLFCINEAKVHFFYKPYKYNAQKPIKRAQTRTFAQLKKQKNRNKSSIEQSSDCNTLVTC